MPASEEGDIKKEWLDLDRNLASHWKQKNVDEESDRDLIISVFATESVQKHVRSVIYLILSIN